MAEQHVLMHKRRAPSGGRPSKGDRMPFMVRTPVPLGEAVRGEAERLGLSYTNYITNVLAAAHGFPPVAEHAAADDQMQLTA